MYQAILADLDHTFYDYEVCHGQALPITLDYLARTGQWSYDDVAKAYTRARKRVHHDLAGQGASHSRLLYCQKAIEQLAGKTDPQLTLEAEQIYWQTFLDTIKLRKGSLEFLQKARRNRSQIVIVTNLTAQIQLKKLIRLKIDGLIDFLVSSEEAGQEKPARVIFQLALEKVGLPPHEVCYIGDDELTDIEGAENLGIKTYYLHSQQPQKTSTTWVKNFLQLSSLLFPPQI